ncbi:MAG: class III poly(R)-hydroxyalkanoic acid synthase subunit PhaC [Planctomycetota bacterium]|nr:class III poly(R)-hydroxyalkanoic acid synthase subunit PhaC [Planctomycetota bacterium]
MEEKSETTTMMGLAARLYEKFKKSIDVLSRASKIDVGTTPADVVHRMDKATLLHYHPTVKETAPVPILVIYALVNRYYMLDLQPDRSMIKNLLNAGFDVYLLDWGYPERGDRFLTLEDYIMGYMDESVDFIRNQSGTNSITLFGICQGGTFCIIYSALYPEKVKNLVTVVSPFDTDTDEGLLNVWSKSMNVDKLVDIMGNVSGDFLNFAFLLLNPFRLMFHKYVDFLENLEDENFVTNFVRMERWIFDSPDQAGEAFRKFIKEIYQQNLLAKNRFYLGGKHVDLNKIKMPVLNVFAEFDHLVPPSSSRPFTEAIPSKDKQMLSFNTGHIGIFVGSRSQKEVCPKIAEWLKPRSQIAPRESEKKR